MVRSGIFLMGSFSALAGLFLLLSADLLASMQLMMYIGGMLVMILFMVKMSMDPGGAMMGIAPPERHGKSDEYYCPMHPEIRSESKGKCPKCGMDLQPALGHTQHEAKQRGTQSMQSSEHMEMEGKEPDHSDTEQQNMEGAGAMSDMDMAMTHEFTKPAAVAGVLSSIVLLLLIFSVHWPKPAVANNANAALVVGKELLGRYMIAFEAGGLLILLGVVGAVIFGGRE